MSAEDWPDKDSWKLGVDSILGFGKYKGQTVEYVLINDPKYLQWIKEKGIHKFKPELNQALKEKQ